MDYSYSNQYSTTSYGAQGAAGGGGFVNQSGSQTGPSGSEKYGRDSLRPVTIKQLIDAHLPHPDSEDFKIDGADVNVITFVAQIRNISQQTTQITYKMDDGTGIIEAKNWVNAEALQTMDTDQSKPRPVENGYARVLGKLRSFNNKRHVVAHVIRPLSDNNEIQFHLLEATVTHLYFTRGPLDTGGKTAGQQQQSQQHGASDAAAGGVGGSGRNLPGGLSPMAQKVYRYLETTPQGNEGLHVQDISVRLSVDVGVVSKAGEELLNTGLIYATEDEHTWAIMNI